MWPKMPCMAHSLLVLVHNAALELQRGVDVSSPVDCIGSTLLRHNEGQI